MVLVLSLVSLAVEPGYRGVVGYAGCATVFGEVGFLEADEVRVVGGSQVG